MDLSWQAWARLYAPYIIMGACSVVGAIYAYGYRNGIAAILNASRDDATQARVTILHGKGPQCAP